MPTSTVETVWNRSQLAIDHWKALKLQQITSLFSLHEQSDLLKNFLIRPDHALYSSTCDNSFDDCKNAFYSSGQILPCDKIKRTCAVLLSSTSGMTDSVQNFKFLGPTLG